MKRYIIGLSFALLSASFLSAQNTVKMSAIKSNDYGVAYSLPKTEVVVRATFTKTTRKVGEFYRFADRYLSISNPIIEDETAYKLVSIEAQTKGIVDKDNSFLVEFKSGSIAPFVVLTQDGIICAINTDATALPQGNLFPAVEQVQSSVVTNPRSYLSEEILRAGSSAKQAELVAKQIFRLRESKTNILTGEADNMPPDGDAYKLVMNQIDEQERAFTSMFTGTEITETMTKEFTVVPAVDNIERKVIFRFSSKLGVVEPNNLAGAPVYFSLIGDSNRTEPEMTAKEQKAWDEKYSKGIIYNIPAKANLKIEFDGRTFVQKEVDVVQFGSQEVLTPRQLENKNPVKIIFYPELGAVKQIIQ